MKRVLAIILAAVGLSCLAAATNPTLRVIFVDVEGGQATLFVTPTGQSLLIDTGWAGHQNRDADRIAAAAHQAGIKKIDYVLLTHYHPDHTGGVPQLVATIPVGTFIDHGPLEEHDFGVQHIWQAYQDVLSAGHYGHLVPKPGDVLPLTGVTATVVSSDGHLLAHNLTNVTGAGAPNPYCSVTDTWAADSSENAYSLGVLIQFGRFRILDVGDLTWDKDRQLACPNNRLGHVSVFLLANHGMTPTSSHAFVYGLHPQVVVIDNGARKGGAAAALDMVRQTPGLQAMWQLHYADASGASNAAPARLANLQGPDTGFPLEITARQDGRFTMTNPCTHATVAYPAR